MFHELLQVPLDVGFWSVHVPEIRILVLVQMVFVKYGSGHGCADILRWPIDLFHECPILLYFARKRFRGYIKGARKLAADALNDLSINTAIKMLRNHLDVGGNDDHQKSAIIFRIQRRGLLESSAFIQEVRYFRPTVFDRLEGGVHKKRGHLLFCEPPLRHPTE